jgi:hypothetical protein
MIDIHLHLVGNGRNGSGCRMRLNWSQKILAWPMLRGLGLPYSTLKGDLEGIYLDRVREWIRKGPVKAAVLLAQDQGRMPHGETLDKYSTFFVPNQYVLDLAERNNEFLAGVSIHPARPDAIDELEMCLGRGAVLLKLLPNAQNVKLSHSAYKKFWQRVADAKLPFLCHTGPERTMPVYDKRFEDPRTLIPLLDLGVICIAAHCATNMILFDRGYMDEFGEMLLKYSNLYGDNSAMLLPLKVRHTRVLVQEPFISRMLYGSDLPVPVSPFTPVPHGLLSVRRAWELYAEKNPLALDVALKREMGFSKESFTRSMSVLRLNEKQISRFSTH